MVHVSNYLVLIYGNFPFSDIKKHKNMTFCLDIFFSFFFFTWAAYSVIQRTILVSAVRHYLTAQNVCLVTKLRVTWNISCHLPQINLRKKKTLPLSNLLTIEVCVYVSVPLPPRSDFLFWDLQIIPIDIRVLRESGCTCWRPVCMSGSCFCTRLQILKME